ncbi:methyltransferase [Patescibacteria group bacterium]|nr:methyltransferase [Patescibacteria group bacterium]
MNQEDCKKELEENDIIPRKYYGQVFTTDPSVIKKFVQTVKSVHNEGTKVVEVGGGLGYITSELADSFNDVEVVEYDKQMYDVLNKKFAQQSNIRLIKGDILDYKIPQKPYILVGNIPFHISGRLYRKFMSEIDHKPEAMVFITDKQYATTLMGQPPRCYRVSLQAQSYGDIEIVTDVPPASVYPEPKVMSCIMKITQNDVQVPKNFWKTVNYHFENFPTKEVESPKTVGLEGWIELSKKSLTKN